MLTQDELDHLIYLLDESIESVEFDNGEDTETFSRKLRQTLEGMK